MWNHLSTFRLFKSFDVSVIDLVKKHFLNHNEASIDELRYLAYLYATIQEKDMVFVYQDFYALMFKRIVSKID
jgi:hypothetical protein